MTAHIKHQYVRKKWLKHTVYGQSDTDHSELLAGGPRAHVKGIVNCST